MLSPPYAQHKIFTQGLEDFPRKPAEEVPNLLNMAVDVIKMASGLYTKSPKVAPRSSASLFKSEDFPAGAASSLMLSPGGTKAQAPNQILNIFQSVTGRHLLDGPQTVQSRVRVPTEGGKKCRIASTACSSGYYATTDTEGHVYTYKALAVLILVIIYVVIIL